MSRKSLSEFIKESVSLRPGMGMQDQESSEYVRRKPDEYATKAGTMEWAKTRDKKCDSFSCEWKEGWNIIIQEKQR